MSIILTPRKLTLQLTLLLTVSFSGLQSFAAKTCSGIFESAPELSLSFGNAHMQKALPSQKLRLLVWNVHKGSDKNLPGDFAKIAAQSDLVLFQESVSNTEFTNPLSQANQSLGWTQAKSFERGSGNYTGVATGARAKALEEDVLLSEVREPILKTPKTILVSEFALEGKRDTLMVANVHAINFVTNAGFRKHIDQLIEKIEHHQGPLVVAGDFNTWNPGRLRYLNDSLERLGLSSVKTVRKGFLLLDHIYMRGLQTQRTFDLSHIDSSDHMPLLVDFSVP